MLFPWILSFLTVWRGPVYCNQKRPLLHSVIFCIKAGQQQTVLTLYMCAQYTGGISWVHWGMFSTSGGGGGYHETFGRYHECIGGYSVHQGDIMMHVGDSMSTSGYVQYIGRYHDACGDIMSTSGGYHDAYEEMSLKYIGACSVHREDIMMHVGDIMNISGGCSVHRGFQYKLKGLYHLAPPDASWYPPMYSWYPPTYWTSSNVLMISPRCTHGIPPMYWISPNVLNVPDVPNTHCCIQSGTCCCPWLRPLEVACQSTITRSKMECNIVYVVPFKALTWYRLWSSTLVTLSLIRWLFSSTKGRGRPRTCLPPEEILPLKV